MPERVVLRVTPSEKGSPDRFAVVRYGDVYSQVGEVFDPNTLLAEGNNETPRWMNSQFIVSDAFGEKTYFAAGNNAPAESNAHHGLGIAVNLETATTPDDLACDYIPAGLALPKIRLFDRWQPTEQKWRFTCIRRVVATSPAHLAVVPFDEAPEVTDHTFTFAGEILRRRGVTPSLHALGRLAQDIYAKPKEQFGEAE